MRQISYAEEFPVTYADMLPSWRKPIPGQCRETSFGRTYYGKGKTDLRVKKYNKCALSQMIKVKINSGESR